MADRKHRIVIDQRRPWLKTALIVVATAVLALAGWALYSYTRATTVSDFERARSERDQLRDDNRDLARRLRAARDDNGKLRDQLAYIKRSEQIDGDACKLVKQSMAGMQQENSSLREQLAFYRGIVSPKQSSEGLRVYDLKMTRHRGDKNENEYDFELLLIQPMHHDQSVSGNPDIALNGLQDGKRRRLPLASVIFTGDKNLVFSFKYFQELDGSFRLPAGFRPIRVTVTLTPKDNQPKVEQSYDWSKIEQATGTVK